MLGKFAVEKEGCIISDSDNRSQKMWLLLAYLIYSRNRCIPQDELINLLWGESDSSTNPANALKTMFHRLRITLNQVDANAGHSLILHKKGSYFWNADFPVDLDADKFEQFCKEGAAATDDGLKLEKYLFAVDVYAGDFLSKLSSEPWVIPLNTYYHNLYIQAVHDAVCLLEAQGRLEEAVVLCRKALVMEPYDESLYQHLIRELLDLGDQRAAVSVYENMSDLLFSNFGIMPSEETKNLYREAVRTMNDHEVSFGLVRDQLRESGEDRGAFFCDYDLFKVIYHAEARGIVRNGDAIHICLLSVVGENGAELARRSLDHCMENLKVLIRSNLRKGDIAARCSISQYILMLPQANYENSCMVMDRITKAFSRQYPHSPAALHYSVQPLEPNT